MFNVLAEGRRFFKIYSTNPLARHPVPLAEKQPQSVMFPPPHLTVGVVFFGLYSAFLFLQARWVADAKELNFGFIWAEHFLPGFLWCILLFTGKLKWDPYTSFLEWPCRHWRISVHYCVACYHLCCRWLWSTCHQIVKKFLPCSFGLIHQPFQQLHKARSCMETEGLFILNFFNFQIITLTVLLSYQPSCWWPCSWSELCADLAHWGGEVGMEEMDSVDTFYML